MIKTTDIISSIRESSRFIRDHIEYPNKSGIYAFSLSSKSLLKGFGEGGQILYVGVAKHSLKKRDIDTHFKEGRTGTSSLRRSIGAILKDELILNAISRNGTFSRSAIDHYKFDESGEERLSNWMLENLIVGYWENKKGLSYSCNPLKNRTVKKRDFQI